MCTERGCSQIDLVVTDKGWGPNRVTPGLMFTVIQLHPELAYQIVKFILSDAPTEDNVTVSLFTVF